MKYLARAGQVFGPYNDHDFAAMKERGDLDRFSWLWSDAKKVWEPLDAAPPPLTFEEAPAPALPPLRELPKAAAATPPRPPVRKFNRRIEAICHDFHQVISGALDTVSESGCSLVAKGDEGGPAFGSSTHLLLSLLDPTTGNSMNVRAKLASASREGGQWLYRLQWESCPPILG